MDCDTTGIEPDFALVKFKKLAGGGYFKIVNRSVAEALEHLGYTNEQIEELADHLDLKKSAVEKRINGLHELNPMLGHRGCRLGIAYPEITEMQARAILEAAAELTQAGTVVFPEIMIPLVGDVRELRDQKAVVDRVAEMVMAEQGVSVKYLVGTMIEVPRGAVTAGEIAAEADFFSFGTNDLTQMVFGFSRDVFPMGKSMPHAFYAG